MSTRFHKGYLCYINILSTKYSHRNLAQLQALNRILYYGHLSPRIPTTRVKRRPLMHVDVLFPDTCLFALLAILH